MNYNRVLRILVTPDSFKGSLSAVKVADAMEAGLLRVFTDALVVKIPIADGGEGTVDALVSATGGTINHCEVEGPLGHSIKSFWGLLGDGQTAVVEMAAASGLPLVPENLRDPRITSSFGTGQLILKALDFGCKKIIIGLGGSATNDGGAGMAEAFGVRFLKSDGGVVGRGGSALSELSQIDMSSIDERLKDVEILVACDVDNPLCGEKGASAVYGPQKGASAEDVAELDRSLKVFAEVASKFTGKDVSNIPGAGAAGGMGAGLMFFTNAVLRSGIDIVIEATGMEELVKNSDLIITGEGKTDAQTCFGKAPVGVGSLAQKHGRIAVCLSGSLGDGAESILKRGIQAIFSIAPGPMTMDQSMTNAQLLLESASFRLALALKTGMQISRLIDHEKQGPVRGF